MLNALGRTVQLTVRVIDQSNNTLSGAVVTWTTNNIGVATVDDQGLVTSVGNGTARITATSGSVSAGIDVKVMQSVGSITIEPDGATLMSIGATVQLTAAVLDGNGRPVADAMVAWQSSDEAVATVSAQGLVTAVSNGTARITATLGSVSASIDIKIMQSAGGITIEPRMVTLESIGETVQLTAVVLDGNVHPVEDAVVTWHSSDEAVATVSAQGLVTAVKNGVTRITAESGMVSDSIEVTVRATSADRETLTMIYNAMSGADWTNNTNWLSDKHVDEWYGVNTDENGRVKTLNLGNNNLQGEIPIQLVRLSHLEGLSLEGNQLAGSIPSELGELARLALLYLFDNQLTGTIPPALSQLENLIHLCLNGNRLTGQIPSELSRLKNLNWLHLHNNQNLTGSLPVELVNLDLEALLLQGTQVCLPDDPALVRWASEISDVQVVQCEVSNSERIALEALYVSTNGAHWKNSTGWLSNAPLGTWYGVSTDDHGRVIQLQLHDNNLAGTLPPELGKLTNLAHLYLYSNQLTGNMPPELGHLNNLKTMELSGNLLSGSIPTEFGLMTNLERLLIASNRLSGIIPSEVGQMKNLSSLSLFDNLLTGSIPPEIGQLSQLTELSLYINRLSGSIPAELGQLANLNTLALFRNQLTGSIPAELGRMSSLTGLSLTENQLTGSIPAELGQLANLRRLDLDYNKLSGGLPSSLGRLVNLTSLNLHRNQFSGNVPPELGKLANLDYLSLSSNPELAGPLPNELIVLDLISLDLYETPVCVPGTAEFRAWIETIQNHRVIFCNPDRDPLVALYHATDGDNWSNDTDWLGYTSLDQWFGVTTNSEFRVEELDFENNNLVGRLPEELLLLTDLQVLKLGDNPYLTGTLSRDFMSLSLRTLQLDNTGICTPVDEEFQKWLATISNRSGISSCEEQMELDDRGVLVSFYNATNGSDWKNNSNWLSDLPLEEWYGVKTDSQGRVIELEFVDNNIRGPLVPELSQLTELAKLHLFANPIAGGIPSELGNLAKLVFLNCSGCQLTGSIPPELGRLSRLRHLSFFANRLRGNIPAELGQLASLEYLDLLGNQLTGGIPPELGQLKNLSKMRLSGNLLGGGIPPELGQLSKLTRLGLSHCGLTGFIPSELGQLRQLSDLGLSQNTLMGSIPVELGRLTSLTEMDLSYNELTGELPDEFGGLVSLRTLKLHKNIGLSGPIPISMIKLRLDELLLNNTQLCAPLSSEFERWHQGIETRSHVDRCRSDFNLNPKVYLTQAVQSFKSIVPVPLLAEKPALLRVFFTTEEVVLNKPAVRVGFYLNGMEVQNVAIPPGPAKIPIEIDESSLEFTANALVPKEVIRPGLEIVVEIDPDSMLDLDSGIAIRVPETGRLPIDVRTVPPFDLTLVPLLWTENPDHSVVVNTEGLTNDHAIFETTRDLLPISNFEVSVRKPVWISVEPAFFNAAEVLTEIKMIRIMDGGLGYYMGIGTHGGSAFDPGVLSFSEWDANIIAHELGHNLSLAHAPCGNPGGLDPEYPYSDGSIGAWGYDLRRGKLVDPITPDIMGYCDPSWISDYHYIKMFNYRTKEEESRLMGVSSTRSMSLLIWGGVDESGELSLEPAFVVDALPSLPMESGPYRLSGEDGGSITLFSMDFAMSEVADGEGSGFAFAIPVRADWLDRLDRIRLSGSGRITEITRDSGKSAAILLDQITGQVRGILRDWPGSGQSAGTARRVLPEPGLEVIVSPGIPDPSDW